MFSRADIELTFASLALLFAHGTALTLNTVVVASATPTCPNYGLQVDLLPQITTPPSKAAVELRVRQVSQTALATCGYINGDAGTPLQTSIEFSPSNDPR